MTNARVHILDFLQPNGLEGREYLRGARKSKYIFSGSHKLDVLYIGNFLFQKFQFLCELLASERPLLPMWP